MDLNFRRRDFSRCDYVGKPADLDFEEPSDEVKIFGRVENIKFFVTDGPDHQSTVRRYVNELHVFKIKLLVRTNKSIYKDSVFRRAGISLMDLTFPTPQYPPEESSLNEFQEVITRLYLRNKRVSIAIQGYKEGPFAIAFAMMVMGRTWLRTMIKVDEFEGDVEHYQAQYLKDREEELQEGYNCLRTRRMPRNMIARMFFMFSNNHP